MEKNTEEYNIFITLCKLIYDELVALESSYSAGRIIKNYFCRIIGFLWWIVFIASIIVTLKYNLGGRLIMTVITISIFYTLATSYANFMFRREYDIAKNTIVLSYIDRYYSMHNLTNLKQYKEIRKAILNEFDIDDINDNN